MSNRRTFFIALIFLATITACVIPGLPTTASAPTFAPTVDTGQIETMVAGTVSAAIALTEQSQPTPQPTTTPLPTATSTPEASATPTIEPTTEENPSGSTLTVQVDASTVFVDERGGYGLTLPPAWLIMRINEQEYLDTWQLAEAADENIQQSLLSVQKEDPNILRLFAIDAQEGHIQNRYVTNMKFVWDGNKTISLENEEKLRAGAALLPGTEILSVKISTVNEIPVGLVELKLSGKNFSNEDVIVFQKLAVFNTAKGQTIITLSTVDALKETVFPVFDAMVSTIKISAK